MLARSSRITHRGSGVILETPLLVPSFSSKGLGLRKKDGNSEVRKIYEASGEFITESCLISAYDLYYKHIPNPNEMEAKPEMMIVDSGGYEISTDKDYSAVVDALPASEDWDVEKLMSVLDGWPDEIPAIFVSYDHHEERKTVKEQVESARRLFKRYPQHLHLLLLKPETEGQRLLNEAINAAMSDARRFSSFDIIGVTEKELGHTMLNRMYQISRLRRALNEAGVGAPIHVFGALDPLSVCLYYVAGAEIFDGLTWIRYGYEDGRAVYTHNVGVIKYGLDMRDDQIKMACLAHNYYSLQTLQRNLRDFETTKDFRKFGPHEDLVRNACDSLNSRIKGRG